MTFDIREARKICNKLEELNNKNEIAKTRIRMDISVSPTCYLRQVIETISLAKEAEKRLHKALDRIEELEDLIDKPPEEDSWQMDMETMERARENHAGCVDGYLLKKWMLAFRKAQNSNLLRKQENERLTKRIKELEAALVEERAKTTEIFWHPGIDMTDIEEMKLSEARKQLHAEGKL